ncbi:MAG TPA: CocE/NonD family hydrolase [Steroidobacteraceae bacterium]|nr:CocE/NonD family hydrolase [Steroidobacteraceae bacterium]
MAALLNIVLQVLTHLRGIVPLATTRFVVCLFAFACTLLGAAQSRTAPAESLSSAAPVQYQRQFGYLPLKDGVRLAYVTWLPKKSGRYPTLILYGPYDESGADLDNYVGTYFIRPYLEAGYALVGINTRGTGCSEGLNDYSFVGEGTDGAQAVEWAARQPWSTGSIGMVGNSSPGYTQIETAAQHPPHLKAIVPTAIAASDYREVWMVGGMVHQALISGWSLHVEPESAQSGAETRIKWGDRSCEAIRAKQPPVRASAYWEMLRHPLQDAYWEERSMEGFIGEVRVPTMIVGGWQDQWEFATGAIRLYGLLKADHKKIILQNGGHYVYHRDLNQLQMRRWLDRWVKGEKNGIESEPPVTVLHEVTDAPATAEGTHAIPGWITTYDRWPAPNVRPSTLFLTAHGTLSAERPKSEPDHAPTTYIYPAGTELFGDNTQFALMPNPVGTLNYRTAPLVEDLVILGVPQLTFYVSSDQKDTDFLITLKDIDAEESTLFLQRGYLRASLRALDPLRSTPQVAVQSFRAPEALEPGRIYEIKVSLGTIGHAVRRGHRLELSILAPNPIPQPEMGPVTVALPALNTVYHDAAYPSALVLPIAADETAIAPPPPCGVLQLQPCRAKPAYVEPPE